MLESLKQELVEAAQYAESLGLVRHKTGNFSLRDPESGHILITPSGVDRSQLTLEDIVVMDLEGNVLECREGRTPSREWRIHMAAYDERPELRSCVHTHSRYATVFAILRQRIMPVITEMIFLGLKEWHIPVAPFAPIGTVALADSIRKPLHIADCVLMAGHGVFVVSEESTQEAVLRAAYVEDVACVYYRARILTGGVEPPMLPRQDWYQDGEKK